MGSRTTRTLLPTEEEQLLEEAARGFLAERAPVAHFRALRDAGRTTDPELWREMAAMGWAGVLVPEEAGGSAMGQAAADVLAHELGRVLAPVPFVSTAVIAARALGAAADRRARDALAAVARGELTYALAIDEGPFHDPARTALAAERAGNAFRLSGTKVFVVDGAHADRLLVLARTGRAPDALTLFDLPAGRAGIAREARPMIDARDAARIRFEGVEATGDEVLGAVDGAMEVLGPALEAGRAAVAAELAGVAAAAFGMTLAWLGERRQFGRPIGSFQALQHRAAHLWCETELTASAVLNAGRVLDDPAASREEVALAVSVAKARAIATARLAVNEGVQMHGGIGMTDAFDMGFFVKRARVAGEWLGNYGFHAARVARARGVPVPAAAGGSAAELGGST